MKIDSRNTVSYYKKEEFEEYGAISHFRVVLFSNIYAE